MDVLVVEDQLTAGLALCGLLERLGHRPRLARSGEDAWDLLAAEDRRLIVTDWVMPGMDSPELCRRLRARRGAPYAYILMLTARSGRDDRLLGLAAGADDFLAKPVDEAELAVRLAIGRRILGVQEELERSNARLEELARTDPLTGLGNRRGLYEAMKAAGGVAGRDVAWSAIAVDVDHFKAYNDAFGHGAGDEVLRRVAGALRSGVRGGDVVFRTGGEEFVVVLPGAGGDEAVAVAERLRGSIAGLEWPSRPVTASFGVATHGDGAGPPVLAELLGAADRALYRSKRTGRDRVTHHDSPGSVAPPVAESA